MAAEAIRRGQIVLHRASGHAQQDRLGTALEAEIISRAIVAEREVTPVERHAPAKMLEFRAARDHEQEGEGPFARLGRVAGRMADARRAAAQEDEASKTKLISPQP